MCLMILKLWHSSLAVYGQVNLWGYCLNFCSKFLLNPIPAKQRDKRIRNFDVRLEKQAILLTQAYKLKRSS